MTFEALLTTQHEAASAALEAVSRDVAEYRVLADDALLSLVRTAAYEQQLAAASVALLAGEVARRSAVSLGGAGLAQRTGHRTATELVRVTTGLPGREASTAVRVGQLAQEAADAGTPDPQSGEILDERPWLRAVAVALRTGAVSVAAAESIRAGLGEPCAGVTVESLASAVDVLLGDSSVLDADRLFTRARRLRDELDVAGIADRETLRYEARSLRFIRQPDGMAKLVWLMDPETAAAIGDVFDRITSPRRGGPRFVTGASGSTGPARLSGLTRTTGHTGADSSTSSTSSTSADSSESAAGSDSILAQNIAADPRTTEQLASDVFTTLISAGSTVDPSQMLHTGGPIVRMLVLKQHLDENHTEVLAERAARATPTAPKSDAPNTTAPRTTGPHTTSLEIGAPATIEPATIAPADKVPVNQARGYIEGQTDPVSIATIERAMCVGTVQPILFDETGTAIDIAPDRRLFSRKQRIFLAAMFGGCMFPGCDRPPSWTEAHHINHFVRDSGKTVVADGISLCKHHHLLLHNQGWEITRTGSQYHLTPPATIDPAQTPRLLPQRSRAHDDLMATAG